MAERAAIRRYRSEAPLIPPCSNDSIDRAASDTRHVPKEEDDRGAGLGSVEPCQERRGAPCSVAIVVDHGRSSRFESGNGLVCNMANDQHDAIEVRFACACHRGTENRLVPEGERLFGSTQASR